MAKKKQAVEQRILEIIQRRFGVERATSIAEDRDAAAQIREFIPTGIDVLDNYVLGGGGLPVGRMSEVYGSEGSGKTSLGYSSLAGVQRMGGVGVVADTEYSFDEDRARTFGVDVAKLVILQPEHMEEAFEMFLAVLDAHDAAVGPILVVWDSLASTKTKDGLRADVGDKTPGEVARCMSANLPRLLGPLHEKRGHFMMLNQIRHKFGVLWGDSTTTPGGNAPKFHASLRLQFFGGKAIKNADGEHIAKIVTIMSAKNRLVSPFRKARVRFDYETGWDNFWSTIEHAKRLKLIDPREDGFKGPGKKGPKAYAQALAALEWEPSVPFDPNAEVKAEDVEEEESEDDTDGEEEGA
jgi:recombination protein RecA